MARGRPRKYDTQEDIRVAKSIANRKAYRKRKIKSNTNHGLVVTEPGPIPFGIVGPDSHQIVDDQEIFAPSPDDYPDLLHDNLQQEPSSTGFNVDANGSTGLRRQLDAVRTDIEHWQFVMEYDDIPDIIWDLWKMHKYYGTIHDFEEILEDAITDGEKLIERLTGIPAAADNEEIGKMGLKEWCAEISSLMSQVHRAIASITVKLDSVRGWQVKKYPAILCPRDPDS